MASALSRLLTLKQIKQLAGERSFQRGQNYFDGGRVRSLVAHGESLTATVSGTENYAVRLAVEKDALRHRCSCPFGAAGAFCKHCVAVVFAWLDTGPRRRGRPSNNDTPLVTLDDLRPWLLDQPPATLTGYLLETAERDDFLREKLLRAAARASAKGIDLAAYRKSIDRATRTGGFIDYYGAGGYAMGVREAIEPLRELLADTPELAAAVIDLTEHALARVEAAVENIDDSNGEVGAVLGELQDLHLEACRIAKPDPEALARRLFEWELADHWDVFYNAVETYAEILGPTGLATYRRLADAEWEKLPALKAGDPEDYDSSRFRLANIMEALARTSGDVDTLAAIKTKDLSHPYNYLKIAELYRNAKRLDDALDWAERGLKAFPKTDDMRLFEFIADEYHRRKRPDDALALIWRPFEATPALSDYQRLKQHADRAGTWPRWRERAQAELHRRITIETGGKGGSANWRRDSARVTLVQVFLWEKNPEAAWEVGHGHPLNRDLIFELAAARAKTHPADAIPVYLQEAQALIARTGNRAYEEAVAHLKKAKTLHVRAGLAEEWSALITRLRTQHKAKRNFIALAAGL